MIWYTCDLVCIGSDCSLAKNSLNFLLQKIVCLFFVEFDLCLTHFLNLINYKNKNEKKIAENTFSFTSIFLFLVSLDGNHESSNSDVVSTVENSCWVVFSPGSDTEVHLHSAGAFSSHTFQ